MKLVKLVIALLFVCCGLRAMGQEAPRQPCAIKVVGFWAATGFEPSQLIGVQAEDFRKLAPTSTLLPADFSIYRDERLFYYYPELQPTTHLAITLGFADGERTRYKPNPQIRLGVTYRPGINLRGSLSRTDSLGSDTLTSTTSGEQIYSLSFRETRYTMNYHGEQVGLDVAALFRTNPEKRWSIFAGAGITAGFTFNNNTVIESEIMDGTIYVFETGDHFKPFVAENGSYEMENIAGKNGVSGSAYIPLGIDFRIGKENEFFSRIHLITELRPSMQYISVPEMRGFTQASLSSLFGLKVNVGSVN